jgi:ubiquinone/menaquinone biosynthesis C-methylase UbiE
MTRISELARTESTLRREVDLLLLEQIRIEAFTRLLFVECGDGWIAEEAWRRSRHGYACGVDSRPELIARAEALRSVPGMLDFGIWDSQRLAWPNGSFHAVISTFALERTPDAIGALEEMRRVLRPGGDLYLLELDPAAGHLSDPNTPLLLSALGHVGFGRTRELVRRRVSPSGPECPGAHVRVWRATLAAPSVSNKRAPKTS